MSKETERLLGIISDVEKKLGLEKEFEFKDDGQIVLTETEKIAVERVKLRLSEIEKAEKDELQRIINDSLDMNEGLFLESQRKEIKKSE